MKDLIYKIPGGTDSRVSLSDLTNIALLNTLRKLVEKNPGNVHHLREAAGVERITTINNARSVSWTHSVDTEQQVNTKTGGSRLLVTCDTES